MCLLLPLCDSVDLSLAQTMLTKGAPNGVKHEVPSINLPKNSYKATGLYAPTIKKSFIFVNGIYEDLFGSLDLARLADWIVFVLPGDISRIDFNSYSELMSAIYSQGLPPSVFVVMSNISDRKALFSMLHVCLILYYILIANLYYFYNSLLHSRSSVSLMGGFGF